MAPPRPLQATTCMRPSIAAWSSVMEHFLAQYGPLAVYFGAATEGDGTATLAGALAHLGYFPFSAALAAAWAGALTLDWLLFGVGRRFSGSIRNSRLYGHAGPTVERLAARVGMSEVLFARFILGARMPSMVFWGSQSVSFWRFAVFDLIGCGAWAAALVGFGYLGSAGVGHLFGEVQRSERHLMAVVGIAVSTAVFFALVGRWVRRDVNRGL